ncbi:EAL domain-containing protein [Marinobacteraceae bacterium S3BR75-40.1]
MRVDPQLDRQPVEGNVSYLVEDGRLQIDQILKKDEFAWKGIQGDINFGYTEDAHWFRLRLDNPNDRPLTRLLEIAYPLLDHVAFFEVLNGQVVQQVVTGDRLPFDQRIIAHRDFLFPITLPAGQDHSIYLRIETSGALQVPMTLWQERAFFAASERGLTGRAMFYGILLVMAAFNLFLYFSLRERAYLYYVLTVASTLVLMMSLHGFSFQYLYPQRPALHELIILVIVPFCQVVLCLFTMQFLNLRTAAPRLNGVFRWLVGLATLCVGLGLVLPYGISTRLSVVLSLPLAFVNMGAGIYLWRRGDKNARLFTVAWISLLLGIVLTVLNKLGVLPTVFITRHGIPLGASIQALLFSFALADRFNREREARFEAQRASLEAVQTQREIEERLYRAASHQELTGLPNRMLFENRLQARIDSHSPGDGELLVVLLHLRRFDEVNKTLGHHNADDLLKLVAQRLDRMVGDCDDSVEIERLDEHAVHVAHVEGVSFAYALAGKPRAELIADVEAITQRLGQPIDFMGLALDLSFMVGCSFSEPGATSQVQTLLRQAFIAFDQASRDVASVAVYSQEMNPYSPRRLTLMTELRAAIADDSLRLYFQPQIDLQHGRVAGFEALLRWIHPEHGFIPPDEFIPMAEQTGLIKPLTRWVIRRALKFCHQLDEADCDATVAVNISAVNLREPGFQQQVAELLEEEGVAPGRLSLEVTETAAMVDPKSALKVLRALRDAGIRLSIDDFGTGHSSLSYIRKLPVQEIKIDRSFVMEMDKNEGDATIVRTTINMCHDLGYEVVAEGVETESIQDLLGALGCDLVQGYHIARPMDATQTLDWLRESLLQDS